MNPLDPIARIRAADRAVGPSRSGDCVSAGDPILVRVAAGDGSAVRECQDAFGGLVWSIARRMLGATAEAEDAVQEVFIELWRSAGRYDPGRGTEVQFVATIARRRIIDRVRRLGRRLDADPLPEAPLEDDGPSSADNVELNDAAQRARAAMAELADGQRTVLELTLLKGLSHSEVAKSTNLPLGTVKTHARRGLIKLRELLADVADPLADAP